MKKTNREMFLEVISVLETANADIELIDFMNDRIAQLDKKASTVSKAQREKAAMDAAIADEIVKGLATINEPIRISDLIKKYAPLSQYNTQKLSPIFVRLVNDGRIEKISSKRTILYTVKA